jgi:hypothetical protein
VHVKYTRFVRLAQKEVDDRILDKFQQEVEFHDEKIKDQYVKSVVQEINARPMKR